jgi:tRNA/tmRNA/rRNA uracil-C5-methylase (TrmA/RlmC/RlmD family)
MIDKTKHNYSSNSQNMQHENIQAVDKHRIKKSQLPRNNFDSELSFAGCISSAVKKLAPDFSFESNGVESLAALPYELEVRIKQMALEKFWKLHRLSGVSGEIINAPVPRRYRATSKRKIIISGQKVSLVTMQHRCLPGTLQRSLLEPESHEKIYNYLHCALNSLPSNVLARALNYCIIRGGASRLALIFNVHEINANVVRRAKIIAENLRKDFIELSSAFVYVDPSCSDYYFEARRPEHGIAFKKLFGSEFLDIKVNGIKLLYPPTVFSQGNEAMLPRFLNIIADLVANHQSSRLLDLYCGYGLLGLHLLPNMSSLTGMEIEGPAVKAAVENAKYLYPDKQFRFFAEPVTPASIQSKLPATGATGEIVLLDPPRQGTAAGVIAAVAERRPIQVIHIFCGTDKIPEEVSQWQYNGYNICKVIPFDMFPGTPNLETVIVLKPEQKIN